MKLPLPRVAGSLRAAGGGAPSGRVGGFAALEVVALHASRVDRKGLRAGALATAEVALPALPSTLMRRSAFANALLQHRW